jgi:ATP-binding cassette subfamily B protein
MDCGPTCLKMVAEYYGKHYSLKTLRDTSYITKEGVNLLGISESADKIGFNTIAAKLTFEELDDEGIQPCILHWNQKHFVVLPPQDYDRNNKKQKLLIADPAYGLIKVSKETFLKCWMNNDEGKGAVLFLEPSESFSDIKDEKKVKKGPYHFVRYLAPYKRSVFQLFAGMFLGSILALIAPFLTQSIVDYGIAQNNLSFIYLILIAQLMLFIGNMSIGIVRSWILLYMSTRVNISIISEFLAKLMRLPIRFFDTKMIGDITQRIYDHSRIEQFLTGVSLSTIFSLINLLVFGVVLAIWSVPILLLFMAGSALSIGWIWFFQKKRSALDYERFQGMSDNQDNIFEMVTGMQEIKMNNSENVYRMKWERLQAKLFKIRTKSLSLEQSQSLGAGFFTQLKNILITFIAAKEVLDGNISLGMLLSISYIIGQMNSPIEQLLNFFQSAQDARISIDRLSEIQSYDNEEKGTDLQPDQLFSDNNRNNGSPAHIELQHVSFQYGGPKSPKVLRDINLSIPFGKVTAIVGASGSGKTTLMKLLLKFYEPVSGSITLNTVPLSSVSPGWWRGYCGVVMSDGYIFSDTIASNICVYEEPDPNRLRYASNIANIDTFITGLPMGYSTKIGNVGNGISAGQRQRILIARAVYKDPKMIFLDEATSTLDANNERQIIEKLEQFFTDRTVVVIAHRLSTVKNADQIVVLDEGKIAETGSHAELVRMKGKYYQLIKNQLELGV